MAATSFDAAWSAALGSVPTPPSMQTPAPTLPAPTLLVAGALIPADWTAPASGTTVPFTDRLSRTLAATPGWREASAKRYDDARQTTFELAHDRWLGDWFDDGAAPLPSPGRLAAIRKLAALPSLPSDAALRPAPAGDLPEAELFWLGQPTHLHVGSDRIILLHGATTSLDTIQALELARSAEPVLNDSGLVLQQRNPEHWMLWPQPAAAATITTSVTAAAQFNATVTAPSAEAAQGHHIHDYLAPGAAGRPLRKLFNSIQMAWHEHPVNQQREARGEVAINTLWVSGPCTREDIVRWRTDLVHDQLTIDERPLLALLDGDHERWLAAMAAVLDDCTTANPGYQRLVLCGERAVRELWRQGTPAPTGHVRRPHRRDDRHSGDHHSNRSTQTGLTNPTNRGNWTNRINWGSWTTWGSSYRRWFGRARSGTRAGTLDQWFVEP